jgi:hypothetical protein
LQTLTSPGLTSWPGLFLGANPEKPISLHKVRGSHYADRGRNLNDLKPAWFDKGCIRSKSGLLADPKYCSLTSDDPKDFEGFGDAFA